MNKFDNKWIIYHELHHRHRNGMTPPQIASLLGMDTRTVKKLLEMSEHEYLDFQQRLSTKGFLYSSLNKKNTPKGINFIFDLHPQKF